jgi:hypothetical protein
MALAPTRLGPDLLAHRELFRAWFPDWLAAMQQDLKLL